MRFSQIPGNQSIKDSLLSSHKRGAVAHAQLFAGTEGGASLSMALAFSQYILCENKLDDDACGECPSCQKAGKGVHPDIHFFYPKPAAKSDPALVANLQKQWRSFIQEQPYGDLQTWQKFADINDKAVQIHKEEAKNIIKTVSLKSFEGNHKILIIWYAETMNIAAANAILKVLEEPPEKTLYFLVSYNLENVITTITSRTQLVSIPTFSQDEISDLLQKSGIGENEAINASRIAEGSLVKAEKVLQSGSDLAYGDFQTWMRASLKGDFSDLVKRSETFSQSGKGNQAAELRYALNLLRESMVSLCNQTSLNHVMGDELVFIQKFGATAQLEKLEKMYEKVNEALYHLERNANPRITHLSLSIDFTKILNQG